MSQDAGFKLGGDYDADVYPADIPNIRLYVGSASDTNSVFYSKYKEGTKQMLIGNSKYFVADINCEIPKAPTVGGKKITPLLSQAEIDRKMRENEIAAMREYYNIFDHFDLEDAVVTRSDIISNIINDAPVVRWGGKKHKYIISYDPASKVDNAPVLITEVCKNEKGEIYGRFAHMENLFITYGDGSKKPMRIDEQVKRIRELIYEYNGRDKVPPYENVTLLIDSGAGGQAQAIIQELCKNWTDDQGNVHPGIYDENDEYSVRWAENYPKAITGCIKVIEPRKFRNELFEAAKLLVPMGLMKFTPPCPKYDTLVLDDGTEKKLNKTEINSLIQLDLMKEEMMAIVRIKSPTGGITYALPPEKRNRMHDDRVYVSVLSCWYIKQLRESEVLGEDKEINYNGFFDTSKKNVSNKDEDRWLGVAGGPRKRSLSPFTGSSPFKN